MAGRGAIAVSCDSYKMRVISTEGSLALAEIATNMLFIFCYYHVEDVTEK